MNKDIRLACTCPDHPKTIKLMLKLGDRAFWCLTRLWTRVAMTCPSGVLTGKDEDDIEIDAGWQGKRGDFVATLLELRWLERNDGVYCIHDWMEHNEYAASAPARRERALIGARARWGGDEKGNHPRGGRGRTPSLAGGAGRTEPGASGVEEKDNDSKGGMPEASVGQCPLPSPSPKENTLSEPSPGLRLGKLLFELIQTRDPKAQPPNMERWAVEIERIMRLDGRTAEEVEAVIRWAHADSFWAGVILSPRGLRDKFTQLLLKMGGPVVPASGDGGLSREEWRARKAKEKDQPGSQQVQPKKGKQVPP